MLAHCVITKNGRVVIGPERVPNLGPREFITETTLRLETRESVQSFAACSSVFPGGLRINFIDGGVQFASR